MKYSLLIGSYRCLVALPKCPIHNEYLPLADRSGVVTFSALFVLIVYRKSIDTFVFDFVASSSSLEFDFLTLVY